ncbi:acyltransferase family protein [Nocardia acidivorans]|uniref:acyltransferase family protein n=1 Tax=Nocardia acidivorans TaxID=404580 RepID=UPI000AD6CBC3|nr:acyltransferase [Nocardia acidivorans]
MSETLSQVSEPDEVDPPPGEDRATEGTSPASSDATAAPSIKEYLPSLDGLRAIVAVTIVAGHVSIYTGDVAAGWNGSFQSDWLGYVVQPLSVAVPFFCVMSGMLLYRQFSGMALKGDRLPSVSAYMWRRALRILPVYWLVVIASLAFVTHKDLATWVRSLLFLTIYHKNQYGTADLPEGLVPTWSLATEVVFYLLLPLIAVGLAWVAARAGGDLVRRARVVMLTLTPLFLINVAWVWYVHKPSMGQWPPQWYWLPGLIGYFAAGMILGVLADWVDHAPERAPALFRAARRRPYLAWIVAALAIVGLGIPALMGKDANTFYPTQGHGLVQFVLHLIAASALVLAVMTARRRNRFLSHPIMVWGGQLSYGVYLWHQVVLVSYFKWRGLELGQGAFLPITLVVLPTAFLLAGATFVLVERPLQRTLRPLLGRAPANRPAPSPIGKDVES